MPQNEYIDESIKKHGRRLDYEERTRKKLARVPHKLSHTAKTFHGLRAKQFNASRRNEKISMRKTIQEHDLRLANADKKSGSDKKSIIQSQEVLPAYLLDRDFSSGRSPDNLPKVLSSAIKQKRKDKAGKYTLPLPVVPTLSQDSIFREVRTGKRKLKCWKRMITKPCFVGDNFTRKSPKLERFIRPSGLRVKKANVTHPELKTTFQLPILGVKRNPQGPMYTSLGVITKGTVIEVNVSELGMVTTGGKLVWGKYAQVTNNPDLDGCINALLVM